jgi:hypothetical protein
MLIYIKQIFRYVKFVNLSDNFKVNSLRMSNNYLILLKIYDIIYLVNFSDGLYLKRGQRLFPFEKK